MVGTRLGPIAVLGAVGALSVLGAAGPNAGQGSSGHRQDPSRVLLRMSTDSGVVGHYRFQTRETHRLSYEIAPDDPRAEILSSTAGPWNRTTQVALTMVVNPSMSEDELRYFVYWLGYRVSGDEARTLTPVQWDSIFRKVGRRGVVTLSRRGEPRGVEVPGEALRPVGEALARILAAVPFTLPHDSVSVGDRWQGLARVPVRRPDGTRAEVAVRLDYRLRRIREEGEGPVARIEFDGRPVEVIGEDVEVSGTYFGEAIFAIHQGRYEGLTASAELEVAWPATESGLPPSRSHANWQGDLTRA